MSTDEIFLAKLLEAPADDTTRLIYADWLDEQEDSLSATKAEFLRLTVQFVSAKGRRKALRKQLQQLAAKLDTDWLSIVSRIAIENCLTKRTEGEELRSRHTAGMVQLDFVCNRRWEDLQPTGDRTMRFCDACRQNVHYCDTITEARRHAWGGHCIAVDLGVIRRHRDLEPQVMYLGRPSPNMLRQEVERMQPDEVSAEREQRKRDKESKARQNSGGN